MDKLHQHPIVMTADEADLTDAYGFDKDEIRIWKFSYITYTEETGYLGESTFIGTLEGAEQEAHLRANRFEFSEEAIRHITLESQGIAKEFTH